MDDRPTTATDTTPPASPASAATPAAPGERRLERPPSDRYRIDEPSPTAAEPPARARAVAVAIVVAVVGAVVITLAGEVLTMTAGLLVIAAVIGWAIAVALRPAGRAGALARNVVVGPIGLALASVAAGQLGLSLFASAEGGVLSMPDYLGQTFGILVPLQFAAAAIAAWLTSR